MFTYELPKYNKLVIYKIRPTWEWERHLKWSAPSTTDTQVMKVWTQETLGL